VPGNVRSLFRGRLLWFSTLAVVGLSLGFAGTLVTGLYTAHRKAVMIAYAMKADASPEIAYYTRYYRSDGAYVDETRPAAPPNGVVLLQRKIFLPLEKIVMNYDEATHLVYTLPASPPEIAGSRRRTGGDSMESCMKEVVARMGPNSNGGCVASSTPLMGFKVWKTRAVAGPPHRPLVFEAYLAPSLDWRMLGQNVFEDGKLLSRTYAVKVITGDPPANLFRVPRDAKVSPSSEFARASARSEALGSVNPARLIQR